MINSSRVPFASNNPKTQNQHPKARIMVTHRNYYNSSSSTKNNVRVLLKIMEKMIIIYSKKYVGNLQWKFFEAVTIIN